MIRDKIDKDMLRHQSFKRADLLYGFVSEPPIFPCKICNKEDCKGNTEKCKGHGASRLGIPVIL